MSVATLPARRQTVASRTLADQLRPLVKVHERVRRRGHAHVDVTQARSRIRAGRVAFDAELLLRSTGNIVPSFYRTATAFELSGIASAAQLAALRDRAFNVPNLVLAWASGDSIPNDETTRLARNVASVLGNALLCSVSDDIVGGFALSVWKRTQCPCCGASPDLALMTKTRRVLVCWRCDTRWRTHTKGCLGCGADAPPTLSRVASSYLGYALAICNSCGRYLKERRGSPTHELLVERAMTISLDEAAQQRGLRA